MNSSGPQQTTHALSSALYRYTEPSMATSNIVAMLGAVQYCSAELREYLFTEDITTLTLLASLTLLPSETNAGKAVYREPVTQTRLTLLCPCFMCSAFYALLVHFYALVQLHTLRSKLQTTSIHCSPY